MNKREMFIQKRAKGLSYEKISKEIGVSKPTLLRWGKEEEEDIKKAVKNIEEKFFKDVRKQANKRKEKLIKIINAAYNSLTEINYEELSARDILNLIIRLESKLNEYIEIKIGEEPFKVFLDLTGLSINEYKPDDEERERIEGGDKEAVYTE